MVFPVIGSPNPAEMPSSPRSKAATAAGTSASVIWRNVTMCCRSGGRQERGPPPLDLGSFGDVAQQQADIVPPVEQALSGELVEGERAGQPSRRGFNGAA